MWCLTKSSLLERSNRGFDQGEFVVHRCSQFGVEVVQGEYITERRPFAEFVQTMRTIRGHDSEWVPIARQPVVVARPKFLLGKRGIPDAHPTPTQDFNLLLVSLEGLQFHGLAFDKTEDRPWTQKGGTGHVGDDHTLHDSRSP